jgi:hypothetical protein
MKKEYKYYLFRYKDLTQLYYLKINKFMSWKV